MANTKVSPQHRKRKVASPALLLLQSQTSPASPDLSGLSQSPDLIQDDQNSPSVAAQAEESEKSTNLSLTTSVDYTVTDTDTEQETFESSRRREDSLMPRTSILGTAWERTDWRKSSADTTHDISELELDTDTAHTSLLEEEDKKGKVRRQQHCVLL